MKSLALFNNRGGVGKTTMTYNLAHMFARLGRSVVMIDCDPQCSLSALALSDETLATLFASDPTEGRTLGACLEAVRPGQRFPHDPQLLEITDNLSLLPGDFSLGRFEVKLARARFDSAADVSASLSITTAIVNLAEHIARVHGAEIVLFDVGPGLGALNYTVLLACDGVAALLAPDRFSLRGLEVIGETLAEWSAGGQPRTRTGEDPAIRPIGYIVQQFLTREDSSPRADAAVLARIPERYARSILGRDVEGEGDDPNCLGHLRHFASLVPLAQAARKPIFDLKHADGVLGTQFQLVERARVEFTALAEKILARLDDSSASVSPRRSPAQDFT